MKFIVSVELKTNEYFIPNISKKTRGRLLPLIFNITMEVLTGQLGKKKKKETSGLLRKN